jgi:hypothetical protein
MAAGEYPEFETVDGNIVEKISVKPVSILCKYYILLHEYERTKFGSFEEFLERNLYRETVMKMLTFERKSIGEKASTLREELFGGFLGSEYGYDVKEKWWINSSIRGRFYTWMGMNQTEKDEMEAFLRLNASLGGGIDHYPQEEINKFKVPPEGEDAYYDLIKGLLPHILISDKHNTNAFVSQTSPKNLAKYGDKYVIFEEC